MGIRNVRTELVLPRGMEVVVIGHDFNCLSVTKRYLRVFSSLGVCKRSDFPFNDSKHEKVKYVFPSSSSLFCFFICLYALLRHAVLRKWLYTKANIGIWIGCINIFSSVFFSFLSHTHHYCFITALFFGSEIFQMTLTSSISTSVIQGRLKRCQYWRKKRKIYARTELCYELFMTLNLRKLFRLSLLQGYCEKGSSRRE